MSNNLKTYTFKCDAVETLHGTAYFSVEATSEDEARRLLASDSGSYFDDFSENTGGTEWDASNPEDWTAL